MTYFTSDQHLGHAANHPLVQPPVSRHFKGVLAMLEASDGMHVVLIGCLKP